MRQRIACVGGQCIPQKQAVRYSRLLQCLAYLQALRGICTAMLAAGAGWDAMQVWCRRGVGADACRKHVGANTEEFEPCLAGMEDGSCLQTSCSMLSQQQRHPVSRLNSADGVVDRSCVCMRS